MRKDVEEGGEIKRGGGMKEREKDEDTKQHGDATIRTQEP